jgi:HlyD family secretion protein
MTHSKRWSLCIVIAPVAIATGYLAWQWLKPPQLPPGLARANGRIEATRIDIAANIPGQTKQIPASEGDFITAGQILVRMDTALLGAQLQEAEAQLRRAEISVETVKSLVTEREAEKAAAQAIQAQREAELDAAQRRLTRLEAAVPKGAVSQQELDDARAWAQATRAAVSAAKAQVAAADAAIGAARSQVVEAQASVEAARATVERIQAEIGDGPKSRRND